MAADKATTSSKGQAWFCTTGLPSDVVVDVDDMTFHLHKFPLMAKSRKFHELITEQETNPTATVNPVQRSTEKEEKASDGDGDGDGDGDEIQEQAAETEAGEEQFCHVALPDFPGGSETFETAAKFCYAVKIDLSSTNVAPLRCAAEVLEMTEEYSEDNLISKTERFLSQTVLKSLKDSIKTLKSCEGLMPLAESLGIVQSCIASIAAKASTSDPYLFGWPVNEARAGAGAVSSHQTGSRRNRTSRGAASSDLWLDELTFLCPPLFQRLITAMKSQDLNPEIIESCLVCYAKKYIPGINRTGRKSTSSSIPSEIEQKELLETIVANLPEQISSRSSKAVTIFFGMLRAANILNASNACRATLEKKIGLQLEQASLDDLLIPSYSYLNETLYDVDCVQRILAHFLGSLQERAIDRIEDDDGHEGENGVRSAALMLVGKLIDGYLSEIASDANLKPEKFCEFAIALPGQARLYDDGLYRSVDVFLKAHPWITEADREKVCGVMDCQKLTLEACTHAAQNERLPLRAVVQVLFFEQLQLRQAIAGTLMAADIGPSDTEMAPATRQEVVQDDEVVVEGEVVRSGAGMWRAAVRDNQVLRLDMDSMRTRVQELEQECSTMKKAIEKIDKVGPKGPGGWRGSFTKKFGCKFKTQVCDSHESTIVEAGKSRATRHLHRQTSR